MVILEWPLLSLMVFVIAFATCLALWTEIQIIQIKTDSKNELSDLKQDIKKNGNLVLKHIIIAEFLKSEEGKKIIFDMIKNINIAEIKNDNERLEAYEALGYTKEAMNDEYWRIKPCPNSTFGFTKEYFKIKENKKENKMNIAEIKNDNERLNAYKTFGYTKEAMNDEYWRIRFNAYEKLGYTKEAMNDKYWLIRLEAYEKHGYTKEALEDEDWEIRLRAYEKLGYTKEAMKDESTTIRLRAKEYFEIKENKMNIAEIKNDNERFNAYEKLGFTKEAMKDENWRIRFNAYEKLGYTKEAMQDEYWLIRINAYENLGYTKEAMKDNCWDIRINAEEYFKNKGE